MKAKIKYIKNRKTVKILSFVLIFSLLIPAFSIPGVSAKNIDINETGLKKIIYKTGVENLEPVYEDINGERYIPETINQEYNETLPVKYDSRDYSLVTPVRNQGNYGYCWSFGSTAAIESSMLKEKLTDKSCDDVYISETGQAVSLMTKSRKKDSIFYYDYLKNEDKGSDGGFPENVALAFADGLGPYENTLMPYSDVKKGYNDELRFYSLARFKDFTSSYFSYGINDKMLKKEIMDNGGVAITMTMTGYWQGEKTYYYDNGNFIQDEINHIVEVVGWDDNFDRTLFNPDDKENQPLHNGAWICKNSWGEGYGDKGYIYISYDSINMSYHRFITQDVDAYDKVYQYSTTGDCYLPGSIASVFTSERDETLEEISFMNFGESNGDIKVVRLKEGYKSPLDGEIIDTLSFSYNTTGIHSVKLNKSISLEKGDIFSVVISAQKGMLSLSFESNNTLDIENVGFYSADNKTFSDVKKLGKDYGVSYPYIKAYTKVSGKPDKTELLKSVDKYEKADKTLCMDEKLLEQYKKEIEKAKLILSDDSISQNIINNQSCILNYYFSITFEKYEINNKSDFIEYYNNSKTGVTLPKNIELNTDIDLNGEVFNYSLTYTNAFSGIFSGNNHTISNLHIDVEDNKSFSSGLFSSLENAVVKDVIIKNADIKGNLYFGGIAGEVRENSSILSCKVESSFLASEKYALSSGGIAGIIMSDDSKINSCISENNDIRAISNAGGITGNIAKNVERYDISENEVKDNTLKSLCQISKTYPKDEKSLTVYMIPDVKSEIRADSMVVFSDDKVYIKELTGKISDVTNATFSDNKWNVKTDNSYTECIVTYSEDYRLGFTTELNFRDESLTIVYLATDKETDEIIVPAKIGDVPVKRISKDAIEFYFYADKVRSIVIENGVCADGIRFSKYINLESVYIGYGTTYIESSAFARINTLKNVILPPSMEEIRDAAFSDCKNLNYVELKNGLLLIGEGAFLDCISLDNIIIPDTVETILMNAFNGCLNMKVILGKNIRAVASGALGYLPKTVSDDDGYNPRPLKIENFVINGYTEGAEKYALENGFKYIDLNKESPDFDNSKFDMSVFIAGDADLDRRVSIKDATVIQMYLAKLTDAYDYQKYNMRVKTCETKVSISNATVIQEYLVNLIPSLDYDS